MTTLLVVSSCWLATLACRDEPKDAASSSETTTTLSSDSPAPSDSAPKAAPAPAPPRAAPAEPKTPKTPPQHVACGVRDFYRVTGDALQVFQSAEVIPPPAIRGSAVARQIDEHEQHKPSNVVAFAGGALSAGENATVHYQEGKATQHPPLDGSAPRTLWADSKKERAFWVHREGAAQFDQYTLAPTPNAQTTKATPEPKNLEKPNNAQQPAKADNPAEPEDSPTGSARATREPLKPTASRKLPGFDGRAFAVMPNGSPYYSTPSGLLEAAVISPAEHHPQLQPSAHLLLASTRPTELWTSDERGDLALWRGNRSDAPERTWKIPGAIIDVEKRDDTIVVLSLELSGDSYRPTITVITKGERVTQFHVAPSPASLGLPVVDLCVLRDRPWVVVGTSQWLQLLDWTSRRLLAEW